jgi:diguanylate cyclase (GGDEF)-like protein
MQRTLSTLTSRVHLLIGLVALAMLASFFVLLGGAMSARRHLHHQFRTRLIGAAATSALLIDGDALGDLRSRQDERTPQYQRTKRVLQSIRDALPGTRYVYVMRPGKNPRAWTFVVDAEEDPKLVSHVGDPYDTTHCPEMRAGLLGPAADERLVGDQWGTWLSGYAPIRDRQGRAVAVLGLDVSAAEVVSESGVMMDSALLGFGLVALLVGLLAIGALRAAYRAMLDLTATDFLSGAPNHRAFQERLELEATRAQRYGQPLSLIMLDLDRFREANTTYGHQGGDDLLGQVARLLQRAVRKCDFIARYGGEEFAVLVPDTPGLGAEALAERIRSCVEAEQFRVRSPWGPTIARLTVSLGVATFPEDAEATGDLVMAADIAMLEAKRISRNRTCRYSGPRLGSGDSVAEGAPRGPRRAGAAGMIGARLFRRF